MCDAKEANEAMYNVYMDIGKESYMKAGSPKADALSKMESWRDQVRQIFIAEMVQFGYDMWTEQQQRMYIQSYHFFLKESIDECADPNNGGGFAAQECTSKIQGREVYMKAL